MNKSLESNEVIHLIQEKIALRKELRAAKKSKLSDETKTISKKIDKIEKKLSSRPLSKV